MQQKQKNKDQKFALIGGFILGIATASSIVGQVFSAGSDNGDLDYFRFAIVSILVNAVIITLGVRADNWPRWAYVLLIVSAAPLLILIFWEP